MKLEEPPTGRIAPMRLTIDGRPEGKARPRFSRATGAAFTPKKTMLAEGEVRRAWEAAGSPRLEGALYLSVTLVMERPKGHFRANGELSSAGLKMPYPSGQKPDIDNAVKLVMDALNTRAWRDDVQVVELYVRRVWGDRYHTVIVAGELLLGERQ